MMMGPRSRIDCKDIHWWASAYRLIYIFCIINIIFLREPLIREILHIWKCISSVLDIYSHLFFVHLLSHRGYTLSRVLFWHFVGTSWTSWTSWTSCRKTSFFTNLYNQIMSCSYVLLRTYPLRDVFRKFVQLRRSNFLVLVSSCASRIRLQLTHHIPRTSKCKIGDWFFHFRVPL